MKLFSSVARGDRGWIRRSHFMLAVLGCLVALMAWTPRVEAQGNVLTAAVLINSSNTTGYNTSSSTPGEFQRYPQRYLEHLQVPYQLIDVSTTAPSGLSSRQLIVAGHRGLSLSSAWQTAISTAVQGGVGFVNLDSDTAVGSQTHIQNIFGATGSAAGTPGTAITVPQAVQQGGATPHFIAALQRHFANDTAPALVYNFHNDANGVLQTVTSTVLTGASGTVIASVGSNPLILARTFGTGRAVHFGTLNYLQADRFGFLMGVDDLFWRSLVWAARKPFVLRGHPRYFAVQMDDTLPGWSARVRDMYDSNLTGAVAADGTGGPWRVTGYAFTTNIAPGSTERASVIADINAGSLQISPHARGQSFGDLFWEDQTGQPLTATTWLATLNDIDNWILGNGGADEIPFISRSMVPHYWNLSNILGSDLWNDLGIRYVTEIQRAGVDFFSKTNADRARSRPFRIYDVAPALTPDETYPVYWADDYVIGSRAALPAQTFFGFATQVIDLTRYDRQDVGWPNSTRPVTRSVDQFEYYTWRLWSSLAPAQIYTHDGGGGGGNYVLSSPGERQEVIQEVSAWLNGLGVRHTFMENVGAYMSARTRSSLTGAQISGTNLALTFSGDSGTQTEALYFDSDLEGIPVALAAFTGGASVSIPLSSIIRTNPAPSIVSLSPSTAVVGGPAFTLTVNGSGFVSGSVVRWNGTNRTTTYVSPTQLTAAITAADIATPAAATVTVFNPTPGGGLSGGRTFELATAVFTDNFNRADNAAIGNGWVEKNAAAFSLSGNQVTKATTSTEYLDNLVYRPGTEVMLNGEASIEFRLGGIPPGYAQVFVRGQMGTIATAGTFTGYLLFTDNDANRAYLDRIEGGTFVPLVPLGLTSALNTTDTFRLRLRATGTNPVIVSAWVEVLAGSNWSVIGQAVVNDTAATRVATTGTVGFTGSTEGGLYTFDNFTRTSFDGANPAPTTTSISPTTTTAAGPGFNLTVNGTNFVAGSVVRWNGSDRVTTFVSSTQLSAAITAADIAVSGTATVTVFNPTPGGGTSNGQTFTIGPAGNPVPVLTSMSPSTATPGGAAFTLTVTGSGFINGSVVQWNGASRTTTFVSATQVRATITAADIAAAGTAPVTVFNPAPVGGTSGRLTFVTSAGQVFFDDFTRADNAALGNNWVEKTAAAFSLASNQVTKAVTGSGFADNLVYRPGSDVMLDGEASVEARFASMPPGYAQVFVRGQMATIGTAGSFTGYLLYTDGDPSRAQFDRVEGGNFFPQATITLSPALNTTDTYRLRLRATGTNPVALSAFVERFTGSTWTVIGQAALNDSAATRVATAGTTGFTGYTEGGVYTFDNFTRISLDGANPVPTTTSISPNTTAAAGPAFTLTVNGTNFVAGSVVRWNGSDRATTFVSATQLTAAITAADIATTGTATVTAFNPAPGGGTSNGQTFTIGATGNPLPVLTSMSPSTATPGGAAFTLTVTGSGFINGSVVRWNGTNRTTTFVSSTQLTAAITAADIATTGSSGVTVFTGTPGGGTSASRPFLVSGGSSFFDDFNRADNATIGNNWTEKFPNAFSIQGNEVVSINTDPTDYHDAIVYRPQTEDRSDVEVSLEFRILAGQNFPQVHARAQRNTLTQTDTLEDYLFFVDGFEPSPGRAIIARQRPVTGEFECYMLAIPFPSALTTTDRYRLRFRVSGTAPVTLQGFVERFNGTSWANFASGTITHDTNGTNPARDTNLYCNPGFLAGPITGSGAVGFAKWVTNNEVLDNFYWLDLSNGSNPTPVTTSLSPQSATAGGNSFTMTVNGANFVTGSVVRWNGSDRPTTFVSSAQVTASITAADIASAGTPGVTVFNPTPGGGTSNAQSFTVLPAGTSTTVDFDNPVPPGSSGSSLGTFQGINFGSGLWVWSGPYNVDSTNHIFFASATGTSRTFQFANGAQILDSISVYATSSGTLTISDDVGQSVTRTINTGSLQAVATGWTSASTTVTVNFTQGWNLGVDNIVYRAPGSGNNPVPATTSISPASATAGGAAFTLTVNGSSFVNGASVRWNGASRTTTFVSATQLTAAITAADIATAGTATVTVFNPTPGGGTSNGQTFTISAAGNNPVPVITGISPSSATAGSAAFTLTVNGSSFVNGASVRWNGANRTTTFVSATQLTAAITAADIAAAGTATVTVFNPTPGGGTSNGQTFTISSASNPVPVTTGISPSSATAGGAAFTLTVNGSSFVNGATVRWNGANRTTTFVSATQLTAAITAADIAAAGTATVTVFNPTPGGGTSNGQTFTIQASGATTANFDNPVPPGSAGSSLGTYQGINFGTNQWVWDGPYNVNTTNHAFFASSAGTSRTFTFSSGTRILDSITVYTLASGTLTISDNLGQTVTRTINTGSLQVVTTGWTLQSTTVTVNFTQGWNLGVDDIVYR